MTDVKTYYKNYRKVRKNKLNVNSREIRELIRHTILVFLGGVCVDCNEEDEAVLEFDHLRDKSFNISRKLKGHWGINSELVDELQKCEVVCANCHRRRTRKRLDEEWSKKLVEWQENFEQSGMKKYRAGVREKVVELQLQNPHFKTKETCASLGMLNNSTNRSLISKYLIGAGIKRKRGP